MFISNTLTMGYIKCFGLIFAAIKEQHEEFSVTFAGVMMSLLMGFRSIVGKN